jgi:hypothetical protein
MMRLKQLVLATTLLTLACGPRSQIALLLPEEVDDYAKDFLTLVAGGNLDRARELLHRDIRGSIADTGLVQIQRTLAGDVPAELRVVGYQGQVVNGARTHLITYQGALRGGWLVYQIRVSGSAPSFVAEGARVQFRQRSLEAENAFTFRGKSFAHYLLTFLGAASLVFILYTLVVIVRTPGIVKWKWILASLFGFGTFHLNWSTGEGAFHPISFVVLGVALLRTGFAGPWILQVGLPVGAIIFHVRKRSLTAPQAPNAMSEARADLQGVTGTSDKDRDRQVADPVGRGGSDGQAQVP